MRMIGSLAPALVFICLAGSSFAQPAKPADPPKTQASDTQAMAALDASLKAVAGLPGYDVHFRQESFLPYLPAVTEGRLALGPKRQVRYELKTRRGTVEGAMTLVCDGTTIWRLDDRAGERGAVTYRLDALDAEVQ